MNSISFAHLDVINIQLKEALDCFCNTIQFLCEECHLAPDEKNRGMRAEYILDNRLPVLESQLDVASRDLMRSIEEIDALVDAAF